MALKYGRTSKGMLEIEVEDISSWDGFEKLVRFLQKDFNARILEQNDGPDARSWELEIREQIITIQHLDTRGNWFFAKSPAGNQLIKEIGDRLQERLDKYN